MSFLTSICVSDIGSIPQNGLVNIFTDSDNYTTPIQTNVAISAMTGNNCPYYLSVPSGTTQIHVDYGNSGRICLDVFDPCTSCNLGFSNYLTGNTATISVGVLTGSCATITDYVINWYGPDENIYDPANPDQNIVFTSGAGSTLPWQVSHPLNEPVLPGFYQPVISQVIINGTTYSLTGGTGTVESNLNCLYPSVVISAWTCDNGNLVNDKYTHEISYSAMGGLVAPPTKQIRLDLKPTTKFLPFYFNAYTIPDTLKMVYYGTAYTEPIILEYVKQGYDNPTWADFSIWTTPKITRDPITKIISLTGLTRSNNDYVVFEIIPNNVNYNTDFILKTTCLENVDCNTCVSIYKDNNNRVKIFEDSITGFTYVTNCGFRLKTFKISGCTREDFVNHNFFDYTYWWGYPLEYGTNISYINNISFQSLQTYCYDGLPYYTFYNPCRLIPGTGTITTNKTTVNGEGLLSITFTDYADLERFYNSYLTASAYFATPPYDPTDISYYKFFTIDLSTASGNVNCGDNTWKQRYNIHQSSTVVTGTTQTGWIMQLSMPQITFQLTSSGSCSNCNFWDGVTKINSDSLSPDYTTTSNVGACYETPVSMVDALGVSSWEYYSAPIIDYLGTYNYFTETLPYTGTTGFTFVQSLSSDTCNWASSIRGNNFLNPNGIAAKYIYQFRAELINPYSDINDVSIYVTPLSGYSPLNEILIYTYSAGTRQYIDTNYIIPAY